MESVIDLAIGGLLFVLITGIVFITGFQYNFFTYFESVEERQHLSNAETVLNHLKMLVEDSYTLLLLTRGTFDFPAHYGVNFVAKISFLSRPGGLSGDHGSSCGELSISGGRIIVGPFHAFVEGLIFDPYVVELREGTIYSDGVLYGYACDVEKLTYKTITLSKGTPLKNLPSPLVIVKDSKYIIIPPIPPFYIKCDFDLKEAKYICKQLVSTPNIPYSTYLTGIALVDGIFPVEVEVWAWDIVK